MSIQYSWNQSSQRDLDTNTVAFGDRGGYACNGSGTYVLWGGDNTSASGVENATVLVGKAAAAGLWSSSYNIQCFAGWFTPAGGSGPAVLIVSYGGITRTKTIYPGTQTDCADTNVATVTVYATALPDGSLFQIL